MTGDALNVRARGLSARLLSRGELEQWVAASGTGALARALGRAGRGLVPPPLGSGATDVEQAVRRGAAQVFATLSRWGAPAEAVLEVFFAGLDRKSLRALVRGAVQGTRPEARLFGLVPTPGLPERALVELSRLPVTAIVGQLTLLQCPEAAALAPFARQAHPPLLELETALLRAWAERARRAAHRGDENLRTFVAHQLDATLLLLAVLFAAGPLDTDPEGCFVAGGLALSRDAFVTAAKAGTRAAAVARLDEALAQTPLAALAKNHSTDLAQLEREALSFFLAQQRRAALEDPLGSAPALRFLLRLEAQSHDLLCIAYGAALSAPAALLNRELVTPWS